MTGMSRKGAAPSRLGRGSLPARQTGGADLPRAFRQSSCQAHVGRWRLIAGPTARRVSRRCRPRKGRARRATSATPSLRGALATTQSRGGGTCGARGPQMAVLWPLDCFVASLLAMTRVSFRPLPRPFRQSSCQAHCGRGRFIAGPAARRVSRRRRPRKRRARRARHVGRAVIARSPCDEAIQGRRDVRRQGAADGSAVAPGLLRRFAPRNDGRAIAHARSA